MYIKIGTDSLPKAGSLKSFLWPTHIFLTRTYSDCIQYSQNCHYDWCQFLKKMMNIESKVHHQTNSKRPIFISTSAFYAPHFAPSISFMLLPLKCFHVVRPLADRPISIMADVALVQQYNATYVFEYARMYLGAAPKIELQKIFGVMTFELG